MGQTGPDLLLPPPPGDNDVAPEAISGRGPEASVPPNLRDRALLLPVAGVLLTMPPLILVFSRDVLVLGVPLLYLYLFCLWCLLILAGARLAHRLQAHDGPPAEPPHPLATLSHPPSPDDPPEGSADAR